MKIFKDIQQFFRKEKLPSSEEIKHIMKLAQEKEEASKKNEPWVGIIKMNVDYENLNSGDFEIDWNDAFIVKLMKMGYEGKKDYDLVDQWFNNICRNVVLETYEQEQADLHPIKSKKLSNGRREYN